MEAATSPATDGAADTHECRPNKKVGKAMRAIVSDFDILYAANLME